MLLVNAISPNMFPGTPGTRNVDLEFRPITVEEAREWLQERGLESAIGHTDTAAVIGGLLGMDVPANRVSVTLPDQFEEVDGELRYAPVILAQYIGPRLPEGATTLPEGAKIVFFTVLCRTGTPK